MKAKTYGFNLLISLDQLLNTILGGDHDTCLSTRAYIQSREGMPNEKSWDVVRRCINVMFFWMKDHCKYSYLWELRKSGTWAIRNGKYK